MTDFALPLALALYALFVPFLLKAPSPCDAVGAVMSVSNGFRQIGFHLVRRGAQMTRTTAQTGVRVKAAPKNGNPINRGKGEMSKSEAQPTKITWQNISPNLPKNEAQIREIFRYYRTMARGTLQQQVQLAKEMAKTAKSKMLLGLDRGPLQVHLPQTLNADKNAVKRTMNLLGKRMYDGIWTMSKKLKSLPPKTTAVLAAFFGFAEVAHTRDEWSQATLNGMISPDSVGFSLPRTMEEFNEGLVNAALDILPDFAFAVPVAMFVANPPAAILWAGWLAVGEYFAKKSWSLVMRDMILPTKSGGKFMQLLQTNKVPLERVFKAEEEEDDKEEDEQSKKGSDTEEETHVPILQALSDSQVDSNLYQYLFMNTLRAYYVTATSIYSFFMDELEKVKDENELTEFAKEVKGTMEKNEKVAPSQNGGKMAQPKSGALSGFHWIMGRPKTAQKGDRQNEEVGAIKLVEELVERKTEPISERWVETMEHFNRHMLGEMDGEERANAEKLAKDIAQQMVLKKGAKCATEDKEAIRTSAELIQKLSKSPEALEEMVTVKLGNEKLPECDAQIEKAAKLFKQKNGAVQIELFDEEADSFCDVSPNERPMPICKLAVPSDTKTKSDFLPILEENEAKGLFKEKTKSAFQKMRVVRKLLVENDEKQQGTNGGADRKRPEMRNAIRKVMQANNAVNKFKETKRGKYAVITRGTNSIGKVQPTYRHGQAPQQNQGLKAALFGK